MSDVRQIFKDISILKQHVEEFQFRNPFWDLPTTTLEIWMWVSTFVRTESFRSDNSSLNSERRKVDWLLARIFGLQSLLPTVVV